MQIHPLSDNIFVEAVKEEKMTKSGIFLPETSEEKPMIGKVFAVGPGKINKDGERLPMSVKVGDSVLFTKYAPHEIKVEDKEYLAIREEDVLAILKD
ncbi:MAG: co-chaperone GroES [Candidatus Parcubacteria bacterium]|nr:co-chaperone GroES [Candidatus Parcubacteria bacterium]